jgi:sec-independent protein translocase protein TatA
MPNIGPWEIIILVVVLLLVFGSRRLPEIGRSVGKGMREFKQSVTGNDEDTQLEDGQQTPELTATAVEEEDEQPVGAGTKQNN